eukprot:scaffold192523_cov55-Attheya_sp.AAC.1
MSRDGGITIRSSICHVSIGGNMYFHIFLQSFDEQWSNDAVNIVVPHALDKQRREGDLIDEQTSTLGNLSPGRVQPVSSTIRYTDKKGA